MNEKTGTGVSSEKEKVKESQSRSVRPSLDTPSDAGLGASQEEATWECEDKIRATYPFLFRDEGIQFSHLIIK